MIDPRHEEPPNYDDELAAREAEEALLTEADLGGAREVDLELTEQEEAKVRLARQAMLADIKRDYPPYEVDQ